MSNTEAIEAMRLAISGRNLAAFQSVLERRLDLWTSTSKVFFESSEKSFVTLLQKITANEFEQVLRCYLQNCWKVISHDDAQTSLSWCMNFGKSQTFLHTLLEAAIDGKPPFIGSREVFTCAMLKREYQLAEQAAWMPDFDVRNHMFALRFSDLGSIWDLPLHDAVANHQLNIIEFLVVDRLAAVDSLSIAKISPLMVACDLVYPNVVVQLLRHGADPNLPSIVTYQSCIELMKLTRRQAKDRGLVTNLPMDRGPVRARNLSEKADYILELLIEAGLTNPKKRFIQHSAIKRYLSQVMLQRLKNLNAEIRSLETLALVMVRNVVAENAMVSNSSPL